MNARDTVDVVEALVLLLNENDIKQIIYNNPQIVSAMIQRLAVSNPDGLRKSWPLAENRLRQFIKCDSYGSNALTQKQVDALFSGWDINAL